MKFRAILCLLLMLSLLPVSGLAEEEEEEILFSLEDEVELEEIPGYGDVEWNFPLMLEQMDPDMIRLANKHVLLGSEFVPDPLVSMKSRKSNKAGENTNGGVNKASSSQMKLQETCAQALVEMFEAGLKEDIRLYLKSAYRSYQTQKTMYYNRLKRNNGRDDGWVNMPGASDHQTGLGCDIISRSWRDKAMNRDFAKTKEAQWMVENAARFGFILRYPSDKEAETEINFEPWHYRYVGKDVAEYIMSRGICLEEFHVELQAAIDDFIARGGNPAVVEPYRQISVEE